MLKQHISYLALGFSLLATTAYAQTAEPTDPNAFNRNVYQQERIDQGLQSGQLSTGEAAHLEKGEAHIDHMEAVDEKHGMTPQEQQQINNAQNRESQRIYNDKHNGITGNPNSASSERMQQDVGRDVHQQQRIDQGVHNGSLTNGEASRLERGQAHTDRAEYRAGKNGHVSAAAQRHIQHRENRQSHKIYHLKHNGRTEQK